MGALITAVALLVGLCAAAWPQTCAAAAPSCFKLAKKGPASSGSQRVTLASAIRVRTDCEYALRPLGPWQAWAAADDLDFATLVRRLTPESGLPDVPPTSVFARARAEPRGSKQRRLQSVFLAGCSEYLMSNGRSFAMRVPVETGLPTVDRLQSPDDCGAGDLSLHFVELDDEQRMMLAVVQDSLRLAGGVS